MSKVFIKVAISLAIWAGAASAQAYTCATTDTFANAVACADGDAFGTNDSSEGIWQMVVANGWNTTYGFTDPMTQFKDNNVLSSAVPPSTTTLFDVVKSVVPGDPGDASQGVLTFTMALDGPFVLTLKGGSSWAGYLFTGNAVEGNTISFDIPGVQASGLSHASIYTNNMPFLSPVPEPTAPLLMLAGLAALGIIKRRAKR